MSDQTRLEARRQQYKNKGSAGQQETRRQAHLKRQREARQDVAHRARLLAQLAADETEEDASPLNGKNYDVDNDSMEIHGSDQGMDINADQSECRLTKESIRRQHYSQHLTIPEWMIEIPPGLNGNGSNSGAGWLVMARPEGKRCLVISSRGCTISRQQSGHIIHRFSSFLPGGSRSSDHGEYSILDCIYHEADRTYYILDMMCWKGYSLYDCTADFRIYWLQTKLSEVPVHEESRFNHHRFLPVPCFECEPNSIQYVYNSDPGYNKDGLVFILKASHYVSGVSPCTLVWKDTESSRYFRTQERQSIVLICEKNGTLRTVDGLFVATADQPFLEVNQVLPNDLLRFHIDGVSAISEEGTLRVEGLTFDKKCSKQRGIADSSSKIFFQQAQNHAQGLIPSLSDILSAAARESCLVETNMSTEGASSTIKAFLDPEQNFVEDIEIE